MNKMFFGIIALLMFSFASVAFAGPPCPPDTDCHKTAPVFKNDSSVKQVPIKNELTAEEKAARQAAFEKALERDHDQLVKEFSYNSKTDFCFRSSAEREMYAWLMKNSDVVIDRKEYPAPAYKIVKVSTYSGTVYGECTTAIIVHYHKIVPVSKDLKKKKAKSKK